MTPNHRNPHAINNEYRSARRRTALVAPGSDERKARKALNSTADEVILDLEDAVTTANKHTARELVAELVREFGPSRTVSVRVNGPTTPWFEADMTACAALGESLTSAIVPKVESPDDLLDAQRLLVAAGAHSVTLQALIETPLGVSNVDAVTRATTRLQALVIGYADLGAALGRSRTALPEHWLAVQDRILIACRTAGIAAIDGPFLEIADNDAFRHSAAWTSALGFDGNGSLHPLDTEDAALVFFQPPRLTDIAIGPRNQVHQLVIGLTKSLLPAAQRPPRTTLLPTAHRKRGSQCPRIGKHRIESATSCTRPSGW